MDLPLRLPNSDRNAKRFEATRAVPHWLSDFGWEAGSLVIRKTGIRLKPSWALVNEIANWAIYLGVLHLVSLVAALSRRRRLRIRFMPDHARPWYLVRGCAMWSGMTLAGQPEVADAHVFFDDVTVSPAPPSVSGVCINRDCTDITKSHVAKVFAEVFGYALTVDPRTATGDIVEKPEKNGVHGGCIVPAPCEPRSGFTYQRIVDTRDKDGSCRDLRTPCVDGEPVLVWVKVKAPEGRFSINNRRAYLADPEQIYSLEERRLIQTFARRMGLDWGGLDILRDVGDGRIYIVDVNKTDLGPVIALSWCDKIISLSRLSAAFERLITRATAVNH